MTLWRFAAFRLMEIATRRAPDARIGPKEALYMRRWWVIPRNPLFNVYLHQFLRSDDDRAMHDHPWLFNVSWLLSGDYDEHTPKGVVRVVEGQVKARFGRAVHRVALLDSQPVWTLFVTGPKYRDWGFECPQGWVPDEVFSEKVDGHTVAGRGCD